MWVTPTQLLPACSTDVHTHHGMMVEERAAWCSAHKYFACMSAYMNEMSLSLEFHSEQCRHVGSALLACLFQADCHVPSCSDRCFLIAVSVTGWCASIIIDSPLLLSFYTHTLARLPPYSLVAALWIHCETRTNTTWSRFTRIQTMEARVCISVPPSLGVLSAVVESRVRYLFLVEFKAGASPVLQPCVSTSFPVPPETTRLALVLPLLSSLCLLTDEL